MSLRDCILSKAAAGRVPEDRARETADLFDQFNDEYQRRMSPSVARRQAAEDAATAVRNQAMERKRQALMQADAQRKLMFDMERYRDAGGNEDFPSAAKAFLDRDDLAPYDNVNFRAQAVQGMALSRMTDVLERFRRDLTGGVRNKAQLRNMVRELFNQDTGDVSARQLAQAWSEAAEYLRTRFNAAGGRIPKREDWGLPQQHDSVRVLRAGFEQWRKDILEEIAPERMTDERTGLPMSQERMNQALREAYDNIATDGLGNSRPSSASAGKSMANRHVDHRFFVFRDADAWMRYQEKYGNANPYDVMMGHVSVMSREIAAMERFGPNPRAQIKWLQNTVQRWGNVRAAETGDVRPRRRSQSAINQIDADWMAYTTASEQPVNPGAAATFSGIRSGLTAAMLGSASISAITDVGFQRIAARMNGLDQARTLRRVLRNLSPTVTENHRIASRSGIIAENWTTMASAQARYVGEVAGPEFAKRLSDAVLRVSWLSPWTQYGKFAFGMEFMATAAERANRQWRDLEAPFRNALDRHGIGEKGWDAIRTTPLYEHNGERFLRPTELEMHPDMNANTARELATRYLAMISEETNTFAVPTSSMRGRSFVMRQTRPGTLIGEGARSGFMFKNFPVTIFMGHVMRAVSQRGAKNKAIAVADLAITSTLMGALALQLKQISQGRDPRNMTGDDALQFWGAAQMQGGGIGIWGDFLFSDVNRFGSSMGQTLAGPVVSFGHDLNNLVTGNMLKAAQGEDTRAGAEAVDFLRRYTPGGSIWYLRGAYERNVLDRLEEMADPRAHRQRTQMQRRIRREYGQEYWWEPGQRTPRRGPDLSAAVEG